MKENTMKGTPPMSQEHLTKFYEKAITAIASGITVQDFTWLVYRTFQFPVIVVDEAYQLLAFANAGAFADPYWESIVHAGSPSSNTIVNCYLKEGYLDAVTQAAGSIYVNWGVSKDHPQTSGAIHINNQLSGFVSLLFEEESQKDFSLELNTILCRLYAILFQTNDLHKKRTQNTIREVFARRLFDTAAYPEPPVPADYLPFLDIRPHFMIAVLRSIRRNDMVLEYIRGRIRSYRTDIIYLRKEQFLYLLIYGIQSKDASDILSQLTDFLSGCELRIGGSGIFDELDMRAACIQQAEYALTTGFLIDPGKPFYRYSDYYIPAMLLPSSQTFFRENAIPPEILSLQHFDLQNQTDYTETMKHYLFERNNLNRAAANLHLHRNTLKYRLDKIESFLQISLDDPATAERLQLGFSLMKLLEHS